MNIKKKHRRSILKWRSNRSVKQKRKYVKTGKDEVEYSSWDKNGEKIIGRIGKEREENAIKEEEKNAMTEIQKTEDETR